MASEKRVKALPLNEKHKKHNKKDSEKHTKHPAENEKAPLEKGVQSIVTAAVVLFCVRSSCLFRACFERRSLWRWRFQYCNLEMGSTLLSLALLPL